MWWWHKSSHHDHIKCDVSIGTMYVCPSTESGMSCVGHFAWCLRLTCSPVAGRFDEDDGGPAGILWLLLFSVSFRRNRSFSDILFKTFSFVVNRIVCKYKQYKQFSDTETVYSCQSKMVLMPPPPPPPPRISACTQKPPPHALTLCGFT